jgi:peroxiredoxin/uncharacterized membrane protein YphA (DoxX/SURF4 family)
MVVGLVSIRLLLAAVFGVAGLAKLRDRPAFKKSLIEFGVPGFLATPLAWLLPLAELACAIGLVLPYSAWWSAIGVLVLLAAFIAAITFNLLRGRTPDCQCFGQLHATKIGWETVLRNSALAVLAAFVIWQGPKSSKESAFVWLGDLSRSDAIVFVLAVAVALEVWFSFHLLRQNGRLLLRLEAVEAKVGGNVEELPSGLPVNSVAPAFRLEALDGGTVSFEMLRERGKPVVLFFTEPGCGACEAALPEVALWQRQYADHITIVPISRGEVKANRRKAIEHNLDDVLLQKDREVAAAYRVDASPSAVLITEGLIASSVAAGIDAIRGIIARATLPAPVKKGDLVPSLRLADLSGKTNDLAALGGRRTLLLFWNPSCGFCQQMLEDVRAWELSRPSHAPELVVISSGSLESNREQGFQSRVLLDPYFGAGQVFNAGGTPSGVLVDEGGKVASDVGVGADEVWALAGATPVRS